MGLNENPFPLSGYHGAALFCDRKEETQQLISHVKNGVHTTLLSIRRMGKTGLVNHVFAELSGTRNIHCVYIDIYATLSLRDFTNQVGSAVMRAFPEKQSIGKKLMLLLKNFRPQISFDPLTHAPELSFDFSQPRQYEQSLQSIFTFLESQGVTIVVALDEFQQVTTYPEKNMEAMLRSIVQPLKNVRMIYSGSSKHILHEMFSQAKRPFFASTQTLTLHPISAAEYSKFIIRKFKLTGRTISGEAVDFILDWTRQHTWYTQVVCNKVFGTGKRAIALKEVQAECSSLLQEQQAVFFQYRTLLTSIQWELLRAIAKEGKVYQPSSKKFIGAHPVGTPANVQRALQALLEKELIYRESDNAGNYYQVYDCFLSRWLERK